MSAMSVCYRPKLAPNTVSEIASQSGMIAVNSSDVTPNERVPHFFLNDLPFRYLAARGNVLRDRVPRTGRRRFMYAIWQSALSNFLAHETVCPSTRSTAWHPL